MRKIIISILLIGGIFIACATTSPLFLKNEAYNKMVEEALLKITEEYKLAKDSITKEEQVEMLTYLASDELVGRLSGEKGNELAAEYIAKEFEEYGLIKGMGDSYFQEFEIDFKGKGKVKTKNVIGYFEGNDAVLKDQVIIVCAHFDHMGGGNFLINPSEAKEIYNGADDNASGTVGLLELADAFSHIKDKIRRTILFLACSGEEQQMLGTKYYVKNPIFPLENTIFTCNLDMIGWLKDQTSISSYDTFSLLIKAIMRKIDDNYPFKIRYELIGNRGDHYPFSMNGIPVIFLCTDMDEIDNSFYHTPYDDVELIDFDGLKLITDFTFDLLCLVDIIEERPTISINN